MKPNLTDKIQSESDKNYLGLRIQMEKRNIRNIYEKIKLEIEVERVKIKVTRKIQYIQHKKDMKTQRKKKKKYKRR